jgi:hypothetical protein
MAIRLDPRRLGTLKQLAAEAELRPGELVLRWVEDRIDLERRGGTAPSIAAPSAGAMDEVLARLDAMAARLSALEAAGAVPGSASQPSGGEARPRKRGRPPKGGASEAARARRNGSGPRVALHDEISAVIAERGPSTAAEIARAITERGRYSPPRSAKPLDAATVNSRVSNPAYRARFARSDGKIGLADST